MRGDGEIMKEFIPINSNPVAHKDNIIMGEKYRITVLTDCLLRFEYSEEGSFEDRATQTVLNRDFSSVAYTCSDNEQALVITTKKLMVTYNKKPFHKDGLQVKLYGDMYGYGEALNYGDKPGNLFGTARTLDGINGACELGDGLMSYQGIAVLDDHKSLLLTPEEWVEPRSKETEDFYVWGYGHDYLGCLRDFYYLCGKQPMLPRFAMGNWWSRYYEYSEETYKELMLRFEKEKIPFSVAVLDMDWHLVDVDPRYGSGWTGYTWNKELFPEPEKFLQWLHERGMRVTLNDHPADGIRAFEAAYPGIAAAMGVDMEAEEPVEFDIANPDFVKAWFEYVLHPLEEQGVDFWWIDWQQGATTRLEGLDPLWMQNHLRFLDSRRRNKRPMILSRYAGPGAHRYPAGFSGDSIITWESLEFQPYFTSTASNIGFGWWSHDIGGHMLGYKDDELSARWLQFGVFSPICRLHSTNGIFNGKEPWRYREEVHRVMNRFLRLRHQMVPYLYTMNYRSYQYDEPLIQPMYYRNQEQPEAYQVPNQYYFGTDMIVAPVTSKCKPQVNRARVAVWLPKGIYIDFFTHAIYEGNRRLVMYRGLDSIPVLVRAGAIIPMTRSVNDISVNPDSLSIQVFAGEDGTFALYEDDNETCEYEKGSSAVTEFDLTWKGTQSFRIRPVSGDCSLIPQSRAYEVEFVGCSYSPVRCLIDGLERTVITIKAAQGIKVVIPEVHCSQEVLLLFESGLELRKQNFKAELQTFLDQAECEFALKDRIYELVWQDMSEEGFINTLRAYDIDQDLLGCITEIASAL